MGRDLPLECEHGNILDWGDFGDERPKGCEACEAATPEVTITELPWWGHRAYRRVMRRPLLRENADRLVLVRADQIERLCTLIKKLGAERDDLKAQLADPPRT